MIFSNGRAKTERLSITGAEVRNPHHQCRQCASQAVAILALSGSSSCRHLHVGKMNSFRQVRISWLPPCANPRRHHCAGRRGCRRSSSLICRSISRSCFFIRRQLAQFSAPNVGGLCPSQRNRGNAGVMGWTIIGWRWAATDDGRITNAAPQIGRAHV